MKRFLKDYAVAALCVALWALIALPAHAAADESHDQCAGHPELNGRPISSLDGHFVYVSVAAWVTSNAVCQVNLATGRKRFVIDGSVSAVIRTGPYRGFLLVERHMYYGPPNYGSYDPVYVVRPDAKQLFPIPGSEADDGNDHVAPWLEAQGWQAW